MGQCGELTGAGGGVSASCSGDESLNAVAMLEMSLYYNKISPQRARARRG
jgi:hypothetical protein